MFLSARRYVAASRRDQAERLDALAVELTGRGWITYEVATLPHQSPAICVLDRGTREVRMRIVTAPDDETGTWYYWPPTGAPLARADDAAAAADVIARELIRGTLASRAETTAPSTEDARPHHDRRE
jgi:hypothetical protein